jgi:hypothetical protein
MLNEFSVIISINLASKKYEESLRLSDDVIDSICKNCNPKYNPKVYFHAKTFESNIKVPDMDQALREMVNRRKCIILTPKIKDYDVVINLLSAVKRWRENCDEQVFGKTIEITAESPSFNGTLHYNKSNKMFIPSRTKLEIEGVTQSFIDKIDAFNKDIDNIPVCILTEEELAEINRPKIKQETFVDKLLKDFPIK